MSDQPRPSALTKAQLRRVDAILVARQALGPKQSVLGGSSVSGVEADDVVRLADYILDGWHEALTPAEPPEAEARLMSPEEYAQRLAAGPATELDAPAPSWGAEAVKRVEEDAQREALVNAIECAAEALRHHDAGAVEFRDTYARQAKALLAEVVPGSTNVPEVETTKHLPDITLAYESLKQALIAGKREDEASVDEAAGAALHYLTTTTVHHTNTDQEL